MRRKEKGPKRLGRQTLLLQHGAFIRGFYSVVGTKETEGPLSDWFDEHLEDDKCGQSSFEAAELEITARAIAGAIKKAGIEKEQLQLFFAGDLLNQIITSGFTARSLSVPFFGLYGACSTMAEALMLAAMLIDGGYAENALCAVGSHFATAERQYRYPLELGAPRTPSAQRTVTGAGSTVLAADGGGIRIEAVTIGRVVDMGVTDTNHMGAAMAPAAADTLKAHFEESGKSPADYDCIATGDLGSIGFEIACELLKEKGIDLGSRAMDCGERIFSPAQDVHAGGSGCGCIASVLNGYLFKRMEKGELRRVLICATGALHSPLSSLQGESIPCIAHAVALTTEEREK